VAGQDLRDTEVIRSLIWSTLTMLEGDFWAWFLLARERSRYVFVWAAAKVENGDRAPAAGEYHSFGSAHSGTEILRTIFVPVFGSNDFA
jgi:hypothetical protein